MQIVRLRIKKLLSISDVEIKPGKVTQICGANNNGKTTVLRAFEVAFKGSTDGSIVKHGENQAEVEIDLDDATAIRRRVNATGTQDVTVRKGDFPAPAPQSILNSYIDLGAFNPLDLLEPKNRTSALLKAIDLKVTSEDLASAVGADCPVPVPPVDYYQHGLNVIDQAHKYMYSRRAEANKDAKDKMEKYRVKSAELPPIEELSSDAIPDQGLANIITASKEAIQIENQKAAVFKEKNKAVYDKINAHEKMKVHRDNLQQKLIGLKAEFEFADRSVQDTTVEISTMNAGLEEFKPDNEKVAELNKSIQEVQTEQTRRAKMAMIREQHKSVLELKEAADRADFFARRLDKAVTALGNPFKAAMMAKAELPIPGLTYEHGEFSLDGHSIDMLSSSKALQLGLGVAKKLSGPLKIINIDGAEMLDEDTYNAMRDQMEGDGFTYFITKVGMPFMPIRENDNVVVMNQGVAQ